MYPITPHLLPVPETPYEHGVGKPEGVVFHATETPGRPDLAINEAEYEARTWQDAFVHFFVDDKNIIQTANTNYECWGCGYPGNAKFVQIELCMFNPDQKAEFQQAYDRYVWLGAMMLYQYKLTPSPAPHGSIWSHDDVTRFLGGTDHTDPIQYLQSFGITWQDHIDNVTKAYQEIVAANQPKMRYVVIAGYYFTQQEADDARKVVVNATKKHAWVMEEK